MKIHNLSCIFGSILLLLTGCEPKTFNIENMTFSNTASEEDSYDTSPFMVLADTWSLELQQKNTITVLIVSEIDEWDYSVETVSGKISNKRSASFDYTRPVENTQETQEDKITVKLMDKENGKSYEYVIPLLFIKAPEIVFEGNE